MEFLFIRAAFLSLFSFEFFNSIKVFKLPLHFPWIFLAVITSGSWLVWEKIYKKRFDFSRLVAGLFLFQLFSDTVAGNIFNFYGKFLWYDRFTHLTGGAIIGVLVILFLSNFNKKSKWNFKLSHLIFFAVSATALIVSFYELWEYFIDAGLGFSVLIDKYDTPDDILFDLIGAVASISLLAFILRKRGYFSPNSIDSNTK